jgi:hypothetical protein
LVARYHNNKNKFWAGPQPPVFYPTCILKGATGIGTIW